MTTPSDEIDFEPILAKMYKLVKSVVNSILGFFPFVFRNFKKILLWSLIGAGFGLGLALVIKPYYKVNMLLSTKYLGHIFLDNFIDDTNHLVETENFNTIANNFNLTKEEAENIVGITYKESDIYEHFGDTANTEYIYYIYLDIYSQHNLAKIEKGILNHLENNAFTSSNKESRKAFYEASILRLQKDIESLDSIIKKVEINIGKKETGGNIILNEPINPTQLIEQKSNFYSKLLFYQQELKNIDSFFLIDSFNTIEKPVFPKKSIFTIVGFLIGAVVSMIFIQVKNTSRS